MISPKTAPDTHGDVLITIIRNCSHGQSNHYFHMSWVYVWTTHGIQQCKLTVQPCQRHQVLLPLLTSVYSLFSASSMATYFNVIKPEKWSPHFHKRPHHSGGQIFHMRKVNVKPTSQEQCRLQWCVLDNFAAYTGQPSKMPIPLGNLDPHLIHGSSFLESPTQAASRLLQPFLQGLGMSLTVRTTIRISKYTLH